MLSNSVCHLQAKLDKVQDTVDGKTSSSEGRTLTSDCQVYVTIGLIILLAFIVTVIKIIVETSL